MKNKDILMNGIVKENPIFVQLLSLCPLLAVTTSAYNAIAMGISTTAVMVCACIVVSCLRKLIPGEIRIASLIIIVTGFVTILQMLIAAYAPGINDSLGLYIALIVVNCVLFSRIESFALKNPLIPSIMDGLGMGIGFSIGLLTVGIVREFFGSGTFFGITMLPDPSTHMLIMVMAPGAFFTMGTLIMIIKHFQLKKGRFNG